MPARVTPRDRLDAGGYEALAEFRYRLRGFLDFSTRAARGAGLASQQHQALLALKALPPGKRATVRDLAERLRIRHHSAVGLVDRLERRGFVRRCRGERDRREVFVELTAVGQAVLRRVSLHHLVELRSAGPALVQALASVLALSGAVTVGGRYRNLQRRRGRVDEHRDG